MGLHRRGIASVLAVVVGATLAAVFAPPPTAQADGTGVDHTVNTATSSGALSAPAPPSDIVGRPAASLVVRTDDLMITKTVAHTGVGSRWAQVAPDLSGYAAQGDQGTQDLRDRLEPYLVTRSARLLDPQAERTLSLQHSAAGSDGLWQLSSLNAAAEPDWQRANKTDAVDADPGGTYNLSLNGTASVSAQPSPAGFDKPLATAPTSPTAARQQWTFQADPAGTGYLRLLNRSDGLCLRPLVTNPAQDPAVGSQPCSDAFADAELWRPDLVGTSTNSYTFTNKVTGSVLTTSNLEGGVLSASARGTAGSSILRRQTFRLVRIVEPGGTIPTWSAGSAAAAGLPGALATGDLDRSTNAAGQYGDEAVVAYTGYDHQLQVRVIDYNANESHLLATAPSGTLPQIGATVDGVWYPGSVGVAVGDFDGDLLNEVAVTWQNASGFHATIMRYAQAADGSRTLAIVSPDLALQAKGAAEPSLVTGLAETTSGDFDGDRSDDLAIGFVAPDTNGQPTVWAGVTTFTGKDTVEAEAQAKIFSAASIFKALVPAAGVTWTARQLHAVPGLFRMDTASGRTMHRRQLEIVWTNSESGLDGSTIAFVHAVGFEVSQTAVSSKLALSATAVANLGWSPDASAALSQPLSVASGGFAGRGKADAIPTWGLAVAGEFMQDDAAPDDAARTAVRLFRFGSDGVPKPAAFLDEGDAGATIEVTAYDRSGTSIVLGAPVVMTVDQYVRATLVAAQPPAHADWLDGQFLNVSRTPDFAVTLGSGSSTSYSFTHTTKASTTLGVAEGFNSTTTVKAGLFGFAGTGGSLEVTQKFGEDWESDQVDTSKYQTTITQSEKATGTDDDLIDGLVVTNTVYRYPILGGALTTTAGTPFTTDTCQTNCYGYYEVTIPGNVTQIHSLGRDDAWYQPTWQNGNALSYPKLVDGRVPTPDVGSYSYVDDNGKTVRQSGALFNETNDLGGGNASYELDLDSSVGGDHERTSSGSMINSQEVKTGVKVKFNVGIAKGSEGVTASAGVQEGSTWAITDNSSTETRTSSSFGLDVPAVSETRAYRVGTAYYTDNAGTQKVVHGVDLTASAQGNEWWLAHYGRAPDLALNLPLSTGLAKNDLGVFEVPQWSSLNNRQRIRGFWAEIPADPAAPATSGVPYADNPRDGDPVVFAV